MSFIYYIENINNGKVYIGSTSRKVTIRKSEHFSKLSKNKHPNKHMQSSYNKYGKDSFVFGVIEECNADTIHLVESHYIEITKSYIKSIGYNKSSNAEKPNIGVKLTEEHKNKISNTLKGRISPMKGRKNPKAKEALKHAMKAIKKKVINLCTMEVSDSVKDFCDKNNINATSFYQNVNKGYFKGIKFNYFLENTEYIKVEFREEFYDKRGQHGSKNIQNIKTGTKYKSIAEAARCLGINRRKLSTEVNKEIDWRFV